MTGETSALSRASAVGVAGRLTVLQLSSVIVATVPMRVKVTAPNVTKKTKIWKNPYPSDRRFGDLRDRGDPHQAWVGWVGAASLTLDSAICVNF
jgi:hypothetical protein